MGDGESNALSKKVIGTNLELVKEGNALKPRDVVAHLARCLYDQDLLLEY
jgi:hypothetical protein